MMRRRGGTNNLRKPIKSRFQQKPPSHHVGRRRGDVDASDEGDMSGILPNIDAAGAGASEFLVAENIDGAVAGPSTSVGLAASPSDFVFKRPKTPPPKYLKKGPFTSGIRIPENRRIRSKLKPGKTGFPIGASLHGLSRSEKLERRSKEKSRLIPGALPPEGAETFSMHYQPDRFSQQMHSRGYNQTVDESGRNFLLRRPEEQVISYPRQTVTKLRFPPPRQRSESEKRSKQSEYLSDQHGLKESLEICQGFSKIKIEDWFPFYDFQHFKKKAPSVETEISSNTENTAENPTENADADDDEWEESLLYVDLEDIPDVEGLFSTLSGRRRKDSSEEDKEKDVELPLSHVEMKIFNLESQLPVLLLGGKYLAGHWETNCGTSLFFKKKSDGAEDSNHSPGTSTDDKPKLKSIVPEPEIPYDAIFGKKFDTQEDGYELVAKSLKVMKARYFPVVNEEIKGEDVIRDADDEFDQRDFQIPPVNMVREFLPGDMTYEQYMELDVHRRKEIRTKWGKPEEAISDAEPETSNNIVKTEPLDHDEYASDTEDLGNILLESGDINEPTPGPSRRANR